LVDEKEAEAILPQNKEFSDLPGTIYDLITL